MNEEEKEYDFQIKVVGTFCTMAENEEQAIEWVMENIGDWAGDLEYIVEDEEDEEGSSSSSVVSVDSSPPSFLPFSV